MTSAAMILALAHGRPAPQFNGLFYATAATVIPVLFLAIAVQGRVYEDLLKLIDSRTRRARGKKTTMLEGAPVGWLAGAATAIPLLAAAGEILAVLSLAHAGALPGAGAISGTAVIIMTIAAATGPAVALSRSWAGIAQVVRGVSGSAPSADPAATDDHAAAPSGQEEPPTETAPS